MRRWVERVIGGRVTSFERLPGGTARVVAARCETPNGVRDVVTKVYAPDHWFATRSVVEREAAAMQGAASAVPAPTILATTWDGPHGAEVEGIGLLMERLRGSSRLGQTDVVADIPAMAAALAAIHDLAPPQ